MKSWRVDHRLKSRPEFLVSPIVRGKIMERRGVAKAEISSYMSGRRVGAQSLTIGRLFDVARRS